MPLPILSDMDPRIGGKQAEHVQKPDNHRDDHHGIEDRLDGGRHRYVLVDQKKHDADDD